MPNNQQFLITESDTDLVRALVEQTFPQYAHLEVTYRATGWDNVMFTLGELLAVRLPRRSEAFTPQRNEFEWLNRATRPLTTTVPNIRHIGAPTTLFEYPWAIVDWMEGIRSMSVDPQQRDACAVSLAQQLALLHRTAPSDAPINPYRGVPLRSRAELVGQRIAQHKDLGQLQQVWASALNAEPYSLAPVWCHGDLHPGNYILNSANDLAGIIDFGDITSGDPAVDLSVAWLSFTGAGRQAFLDTYRTHCDASIAADSGLIPRARGWVISAFVSSVLTSDLSTPDFVDTAHWATAQLLHDTAR